MFKAMESQAAQIGAPMQVATTPVPLQHKASSKDAAIEHAVRRIAEGSANPSHSSSLTPVDYSHRIQAWAMRV